MRKKIHRLTLNRAESDTVRLVEYSVVQAHQFASPYQRSLSPIVSSWKAGCRASKLQLALGAAVGASALDDCVGPAGNPSSASGATCVAAEESVVNGGRVAGDGAAASVSAR